MLREIYRTVPIPYLKVGDPPQTDSSGTWVDMGGNGVVLYPTDNYPPYIENLDEGGGAVQGLFVIAPGPDVDKYALKTSPASLYVWCNFASGYWPSWRFGYFRFNAMTGELVRRMPNTVAGGTFGTLGAMFRSRNGVVWMRNFWATVLQKASIGGTASALIDDEPDDMEGWFQLLGETITLDQFGPYNDEGDTLLAFGHVAIDEKADVFMNAATTGFSVYTLSTGTIRYHTTLPTTVRAIALEDDERIYVLLSNKVLFLYNYVRGEVLGSVRLQVTNFRVTMTWDAIFRRLLLCEITPNNADGSSTTRVKGYRQVPEGVRLTMPIPLKAPRRGRTIPVLTQVVGDLNEGVGGYVVKAQVTGAGVLMGMPITNHYGECRIQVKCGADYLGYEYQSPESPDDASSTLTQPGVVTVLVSANIYVPDAGDIPISGAPRTAGGTPQPPGSGGGDTGNFLWDWNDRGGPDAEAPGSPVGAPTNMSEWETYFFGLIDRTKGTQANDYQAVLNGLKDQGMRVNATLGAVPQESWTFYGMSVVIDAAGSPRGRMQLPTAETDANGYYIHEIQVIKDNPTIPATYESAPNMFHLVQQVYNSQTWRLGEAYEDAADGRGVFTEKCVTAMHDVDARWGHIKKVPGQNQYNGHAVDAIVFLNDDGVTGEIFDIVRGGGTPMWMFVDRSTANREKWYYPA